MGACSSRLCCTVFFHDKKCLIQKEFAGDNWLIIIQCPIIPKAAFDLTSIFWIWVRLPSFLSMRKAEIGTVVCVEVVQEPAIGVMAIPIGPFPVGVQAHERPIVANGVGGNIIPH